MGIFKGVWTFKVSFEITVDSLSDYTKEMLYNECAEAIYANSPWSREIEKKNRDNFKVVLVHSETKRDDSYESIDILYKSRLERNQLKKYEPRLDDLESN